MRATLFALLVSTGLVLAGSISDYVSAKQKMALIADDKAPSGSIISFNAEEINAYAATEVLKAVPEGIRNTRIELGDGTATGSAIVNFPKLLEDVEGPSARLLTLLLGGEKVLSVTVQLESGHREALVDVEKVVLSGVVFEGDTLEFMIDHLLLPRFPDAIIGEPFELKHNMEQIRVQPGGVDVKIGN